MWRLCLECGPVSGMCRARNQDHELTQPPVFSKCAESIEGGKRLENLTWRLWNRETFCCEAQPNGPSKLAEQRLQHRPSKKEIPALSTSVDSAYSEQRSELDTASVFPPPSDDSCLSRSRGKEKHMTPLGLEKMVYSIKERTELEPLPPTVAASMTSISDNTPRPSSPSPRTELQQQPSDPLQNPSESWHSATTVNDSQSSDHRGSDTSASSTGLIRSGSIVHGFCPSPFSAARRVKGSPAAATLTADDALTRQDALNKKAGMFTLGGSSGDDESSFEDRMCKRSVPSSLSDRLKQSETTCRPSSFKTMLQSKQIRSISEGGDEDEGAIETDDDEVDESAIEEDDDSDWEDSVVESGKSSLAEDKPDFKRVDSRPNLVSRKSLLTRGLHEPQRAAALAEAAMRQSSTTLCRSRTSSPTGPSAPTSPIHNDGHGIASWASDSTRSKPISCNISQPHLPAHSPRTTRRNMLATELTESLRRHLLWERQQKSTTANAVFKRRHTAQKEMTSLHDLPGAKASQPIVEAPRTNSWNHHFDNGTWEYHAKGW